VPKFHSTFG
jgi:hypothetical protein